MSLGTKEQFGFSLIIVHNMMFFSINFLKATFLTVCITEMEMRHQPRCPSPMCTSGSTWHEEQVR